MFVSGLLAFSVLGGGQFPLADFVGKDLKSYSIEKLEPMKAFLKAKGQPFPDGYWPTRPWALWDWNGDGSKFVLVGGSEAPNPGSTSASVTVLDRDGNIMAATGGFLAGQTGMAYRGLSGVSRQTVSSVGRVIRFDTSTCLYDQEDVARFYVGLDGPHPALIRIEDSKGRAIRNCYQGAHASLGPTQNPFSIEKGLDGGSTIGILGALSWCGGEHVPATTKLEMGSGEAVGDSLRYREVASDKKVNRQMDLWAHSSNAWLREAAALVQSNAGWGEHAFSPKRPDGPVRVAIHDLSEGGKGRFGHQGEPVQKGDRVVIGYRIQQRDGKVVVENGLAGDASWPIWVGNGEVLDGIDRGLVGMKVGGVRRMEIPWRLAYGSLGIGNVKGYTNVVATVRLFAKFSRASLEKEQIYDQKLGEGAPLELDDYALVRWGFGRPNGYVVKGLADSKPFWVVAGKGKGGNVEGMRVGGIRQILAFDPMPDLPEVLPSNTSSGVWTVEVLKTSKSKPKDFVSEPSK